MRWIYLSPHLDDAVLSAGGLIFEQIQAGRPVEIWTLMCGFPKASELTEFARSMHRNWETGTAAETVRARRVEDQNAAALLGAKAVHFDFLDCIYRRGRTGQALYTDIYAPLHEEEADLPAQVAQTIVARLHSEDVLVCQLAIGAHVDHVVVRKAAELLNRPRLYIADIPYLLKNPLELGRETVGMKESVQEVSESGLEAWIGAIEAYPSQLSSLFNSPDSMREGLEAYWLERKGVSLWEFVQTTGAGLDSRMNP